MRRALALTAGLLAAGLLPHTVSATTPAGQTPAIKIISETAATAPPVPAAAPAAATPAPATPAPATPAASAPAAAEAPAADAKPVEPPKPVLPTLIAKVNLTTQTMVVVINGKPTYTWKVSSGADGYATPVGNFKPDWMAKMWYSRQYDNAPMPHAVFFKGGAAIHATTSIGRLGTAASHGCVRLSPANAETFYKLVSKHSLALTRVVVSGHAPTYGDRIARRERSTGERSGRQAAYQPQGMSAYQAQRVQVASSRQLVYPGDAPRYAVPAGATAANRTPYWVRY